jgi:nucleoside-triphosphatase
MTHIFLTGDIQIGKSTVIRKTLLLLKPRFGGFCTCFGPDRANPNRCLFMHDAASQPVYDEQHIVARFREGRAPEVYPGRFDALGTYYMSKAGEKSTLIIMDECGGLERDALAFHNAVLSALDGDVPILGVLKANSAGWTDKIRRHPGVKLITVDRGNRDMLPRLIAPEYRG